MERSPDICPFERYIRNVRLPMVFGAEILAVKLSLGGATRPAQARPRPEEALGKMMSVQRILGRVFLDTSALQSLQDYGEFIYDGGDIPQADSIWSIPDGFANVEALREIVLVAGRGSLQFALSRNSLQEVLDRGRYDYLQWALEMLDYWEGCLAAHEDTGTGSPGRGIPLSTKPQEKHIGYLSTKDARLIRDAVALECDVFLTMERKLPKNAPHIENQLGIKVMQPMAYRELLRPWAALLA